ncbi:MAG: GIY-YIG nuclease family protein [Acidilobaceae archaeon]|nr:GIY-YIG nuclease family protein [Acidilobaceae archaeon]
MKGVYALLFFLCDSSPRVGSLGTLRFSSGLYLYIGSARGQGGVRARISRHLRKEKVLRWHIDYLTSLECSRPLFLAAAESPLDAEERVASELENSLCFSPSYRGFGSSDKSSRTHLFRCDCSVEDCAREVLIAMSRAGLKGELHLFSR